MDELLKELRNYLADARKRDEAAQRRHKENLEALHRLTIAIEQGCTTLSNTMLDTRTDVRR
jgi:hypothetical protein